MFAYIGPDYAVNKNQGNVLLVTSAGTHILLMGFYPLTYDLELAELFAPLQELCTFANVVYLESIKLKNSYCG